MKTIKLDEPTMKKSEILFRAMQIAGVQGVDENRARMILAFVEKLETFGMGLSIREIEATAFEVTKKIQAENIAKGNPLMAKNVEEVIELPISEGGEA